ncbi:protein p13 MTCP-1-like [Dermochelys coriacea]|uniref:protein p13 MTCP-1-like n=1 Tax=Dermochelys coriacea TaxID=27794 RepID=UPI001CA7E9E3|nr:protein p13 MTCP-1-like [Dermochelys coriacea]
MCTWRKHSHTIFCGKGEDSMQAIPLPNRLWAWCPGVYHDEQGHMWVAVLRKDLETGILRARVRAEQVPLGDSWTRSQFPLSPLPHLWQWCPCGLYRAAGGIGEDEWWLESHQVVSGVPEMLLRQLHS